MINAVVFDLWETLATKNVGVSKTLQTHFGIPKTDDFVRRYEQAVQLERWQTKQAMAESFLRAFDIPNSPDAVAFVLQTLIPTDRQPTLFEGIRPLLETLHTKVKLGLLSNTTVFESAAIEHLGIAQLFTATLFSWEIGSLKPSNQNFREILTRLQANAQETLFVDDSAKNVGAAAEFGLQAVRFESVGQLQESLTQLEIIP